MRVLREPTRPRHRERLHSPALAVEAWADSAVLAGTDARQMLVEAFGAESEVPGVRPTSSTRMTDRSPLHRYSRFLLRSARTRVMYRDLPVVRLLPA